MADLFDRKKNRYLKHAVDVRLVPVPEPEETPASEGEEKPVQSTESETATEDENS